MLKRIALHRGSSKARSIRGAATLEFYVVALFALLPLCLGTLQIALLLVDNHHIDFAAFMAARQGAVAQGDMGAMRRGFVRAITSRHMDSFTPLNRNNLTARVTEAYARATTDVLAFARFRLLAPDSAAQTDFAIRRDGDRVIPNDSLEYRSVATGVRSGHSLQQANILRIEISYCRPLIVPFARELLLATLRTIDAEPWHQRCYGAGRVPIRSEGSAPMQSDFKVTS
jgi:hypothetical protein